MKTIVSRCLDILSTDPSDLSASEFKNLKRNARYLIKDIDEEIENLSQFKNDLMEMTDEQS